MTTTDTHHSDGRGAADAPQARDYAVDDKGTRNREEGEVMLMQYGPTTPGVVSDPWFPGASYDPYKYDKEEELFVLPSEGFDDDDTDLGKLPALTWSFDDNRGWLATNTETGLEYRAYLSQNYSGTWRGCYDGSHISFDCFSGDAAKAACERHWQTGAWSDQ